MDINSNCGICCLPLDCWPNSGDMATGDLALMKLPCDHLYHHQCAATKERTSCGLKILHEQKMKACALCRAPFDLQDCDHILLAAFLDNLEVDEDETESEGSGDDNGSIEVSDEPNESPIQLPLHLPFNHVVVGNFSGAAYGADYMSLKIGQKIKVLPTPTDHQGWLLVMEETTLNFGWIPPTFIALVS